MGKVTVKELIMENKKGLYTSYAHTFNTKKDMIEFMRSHDQLPYKDHSVQTITGHGVGIWTKVMSTYYFVEFTSGNLNRERISL
jgi:hypothetical protein